MSSGSQLLSVDTPLGSARFYVDGAEDQRAVLILGHGAGGGVNAMDLELLARRLPERGVTVLRFEQPWRTAGRKVGAPPPKLDEAWLAAVGWLLDQSWTPGPLFFGGRSAGARVACRTADRFDVAGIVCLAFPLHLPGQPAKSRSSELLTPKAPRLVLQGTNDSFGRPEEIRAAIGDNPGISLIELPGADHGYRIARRRAEEERADNASSSVSDDEVGGFERDPQRAERAIEHRIAKAAPFTPADLRATLVTQVGAFIERRLAESAGISPGSPR